MEDMQRRIARGDIKQERLDAIEVGLENDRVASCIGECSANVVSRLCAISHEIEQRSWVPSRIFQYEAS